MYEFLLGTRFYYKDKLVEVVESDGNKCLDCVFSETFCIHRKCLPVQRHDKKSVYFKEVNDERLQAED